MIGFTGIRTSETSISMFATCDSITFPFWIDDSAILALSLT